MSTAKQNKTRLRRALGYAYLACAAFAFLFVAHLALAQGITSDLNNFGLNQFGNQTNLGTNIELIGAIARIINIVLGFLGVLAVGLILYAGFLWMTARGDEERITKAKKILTGGLVGLIIILSAYAIASFIVTQLGASTGFNGGGGGGGLCADGTTPPCSFGSNNYLRATSVAPIQAGISLCSAVQTQFNVGVRWSSVTPQNFKVVDTSDNSVFYNSATDHYDPGSDSTVIGFRHPTHDFQANHTYQVTLAGTASGLRSIDIQGDSWRFKNDPGKQWTFTTGTQSDSTRPTVVTVVPASGATDICLRSPIQVKFSEPMYALSFEVSNPPAATDTVILRERLNPSVLIRLDTPIFSNNFKTATLTPHDPLDSNKQYEVVLKGGVGGLSDLCQNTLLSDYTWGFTTGTTAFCTPTLTQVSPIHEDYGRTVALINSVKLTGSNLFLDGAVQFNGVTAGDNSFDDQENVLCWNGDEKYNVGDPLYQTCNAGEVKVRVPVGVTTGAAYDQDSYTAATGPVKVVVGTSSSNELPFSITSPYVDTVSPSRGGVGQFVTLRGWNFGSQAGQVKFIVGSTAYPAPPPQSCSDWWHETQIIVKVPAVAVSQSYQVQVVTASGGSNAGHKPSNLDNFFTVTNDTPGPGLCTIVPAQAEVSSLPQNVSLAGERLGAAQGTSTLSFGVHGATKFSAPYQWSDTRIDTQTPTGSGGINVLAPDSYPVRVTTSLGTSNPVWFKVNPVQYPTVVESPICSAATQSPSPYKGSTSVCRNSLVSARFNQTMNFASFTNHIQLSDCGPDGRSCGPVSLTGLLQPILQGADVVGFTADYGELHAGHVYEGKVLAGVANPAGVAMPSPYTWRFTTSNTLCQIASVRVAPANYTLRSLHAPVTYMAYPTAANCNLLGSASYTWSWSSTDTANVPVTPSHPGQASASAIANDWPSPDHVIITARESSGVSGTGDLWVNPIACTTNSDCSCGTTVTSCVNGQCAPSVQSFSPTTGAIGTWVAIHGCFFGNTKGSVLYSDGTNPAQLGLWPSGAHCPTNTWSNIQIISEVPNTTTPDPSDDARTGAFKVVRPSATPGEATSPTPYIVNPGIIPPGICRITPTSIYQSQLGSTSVEFFGKNFGTAPGAVTHYSADESIHIDASVYPTWQPDDVVAKVPSNAPVSPGAAVEKISLTNAGTESSHLDFDIIPAATGGGCNGVPVVARISPGSGISSSVTPTVVTLQAAPTAHFGTGGSVKFGSVVASQAACGYWKDDEIVVGVPPGLPLNASTPVVVQNNCGTSAPVSFNVDTTIHPGICSLTPTFGREGTQVSVSGYNFTDNRGPVTAGQFKVASTANSNTRSFVSVTCNTADAQSGCLGSIDEGAPVNATGGNRYKLYTPQQISAWHNNQVTFALPHLTRTGAVRVTVDYPAGSGGLQASNGVTFTAEPFITSLSPATAATGTWVTVRGGNFGVCSPHPGSTCAVTFDSGGGRVLEAPLPDICLATSWSDSQIITKVPAGTHSGLVKVLTPNYGETSVANSKQFTLDENVPAGPGLCSMTWPSPPYPALAQSDFPVLFTLAGDRFGASQGSSQINFPGYSRTPSNTWSEQQISSINISSATSGNVTVDREFTVVTGRVCPSECIQVGNSCTDGAGNSCWQNVSQTRRLTSNPLALTVQGSNPGGGDLPAVVPPPVPAAGSVSSCRNLAISVTFDAPITPSAVTGNQFKLVRTSGSTSCDASAQESTSQSSSNWWQRLASLFLRAAVGANTVSCQVSGALQLSANNRTLSFIPAAPLMAGANYQATIASPNVQPYSWSFSTSSSAIICQIARVTVTPASYTFTTLADQRDFTAQALAPDGTLITAANFAWTLNDPSGTAQIRSGSATATVMVAAQNKNGSATLNVAAQDAQAGTGHGSAALSTYLCEVPWELADPDYNFRLRYCRSQATVSGTGTLEASLNSATITGQGTHFQTELAIGDSIIVNGEAREVATIADSPLQQLTLVTPFATALTHAVFSHAQALPQLNKLVTNYNPPTATGLLREYFLKVPNSNDAVGLRIYQNPDRLSPRTWYSQQPDITHGNPSVTTVFGYDALRDGQSTYVGAANKNSGNDLYTNVYILSYNQGANTTTSSIVQQLLQDWTFNTNVTSADDISFIQRDLRRVTNLSEVQGALSAYAAAHSGSYPLLSAGSYLTGMSTSAWPSWQAELANELERALPTDPLNTFNQCPTSYDQTTCWNPRLIGPPDQRFVCPDGSHVYQYVVDPSGHSYQFFMNFEYKGVVWRGTSPVSIPAGNSCRSFSSGSTASTS